MYSGAGAKRENLSEAVSEPARKSGALQKPGTIAPLTSSPRYEPERLIKTKTANLLMVANLAPADVVNKTSARFGPSPADITILSRDLSPRFESKDTVSSDEVLRLENKCSSKTSSSGRRKSRHTFRIVDSSDKDTVSLDDALRLENKYLTRARSPMRSKSSHPFKMVDSSYSRAKRSNDNSRVDSALSLALSDDELASSDPENNSDSGPDDFSAQSPRTSRFLLQVRTPRSLRSTKFKSLLAPVQEYEER